MTLTPEQKLKLAKILENYTYPKEQLGFFTMDDLITLIEDALS